MKDLQNIAFYSSNGFQETFTANHVRLIPAKYHLSGGTPPTLLNGKPILPMDKISVLRRKISLFFGKKQDPFLPFVYFLKKYKPLLIVAEFGPAGAEIYKICEEFHVPIIVNFYGIDAFGHSTLTKYSEKYKGMFRYARFFSVQSRSIKKQLINLGCEEEKIIVNSCPPDDNYFQYKPDLDSNRIISVGRFVDKKAPFILLLIFKKVIEKIPDLKITMVGDGPLFISSVQLAKVLEIDKNIEFTGRLDPKEQLEKMRQSMIFVQHSVVSADGDAEGLPVAIMEASAMSMPVVSTYHSGIPEAVIHEKTGLLSDELDLNSMAENLIQLLQDKSLAKKMGEEGKEFMEKNFTMKSHVQILGEIISKSIKK